MSKKLLDEEIIIESHNQYFLNLPPIKKIKNILIIAGGGTSATFFTMGAVKCLYDNNMLLNFDVMSSVSGGTILLHFVEQAFNQGYYKLPDWYNRYIRKPFYDVVQQNIFAKLLFNGFNIKGLQQAVLELLQTGFIDYYNKPLDINKLYTRTIFEYNYLDKKTQHVSDNHKDLIDLENNVKQDNWYTYRLLRCCLPYTKFNGIAAFDAGSSDNNAFSTALSKYDADNIFYITPYDDFIYKKYKKTTFIEDLTNILGTVITASNNATIHLAHVILKNKNIVLCSLSNGLLKSEDKFHSQIFNDYYKEIPQSKTYYNGVLFTNLNMLKVLENEGYIQMYNGIKNCKGLKMKNLNFNIPNPDVYNSNVSKIYEEYQKLNVTNAILKNIFNELKNRITKK